MKCNQRLKDNCINIFVIWAQICVLVYTCNIMDTTFFHLEIITLYLWTFKFVNLFCYKLQIGMWNYFPMEKASF
jgi:hypothetical protein